MGLRERLRRSAGASGSVAPDLLREARSTIPWMYEWRFTADVATPPQGSELREVHHTRLATIEPAVRAALEEAGPQARVLDVGCNEGWFGHRMLEWGAGKVLGVDIRQVNVWRARLVRDHFRVSADRLDFIQGSVYDLDPAVVGEFDLVLLLGLIYHLENPIGAIRVARNLARRLVVVETQLTAQEAPVRVGAGQSGVFEEVAGHWAALYEPPHEQMDEGNLLSSYGGVVSLIPNRPALLEAMSVAGLTNVRMLDVASDLNRQYVEGHRGIAIGRPATT
jgi:tRNA (mo5U34)-methyltransferase